MVWPVNLYQLFLSSQSPGHVGAGDLNPSLHVHRAVALRTKPKPSPQPSFSLVSCLTWLTVLGIKCCLPLNVTSRSLGNIPCCFHLSFPFMSHFPLSSEFLPCFLLFQFLYFPASCADFSFSFCCLEVLSSLKHLHLEHLLHILLVSLAFCVAGLLPQRLAWVCTARLFVGSSQEVVLSVSWTAASGDNVSLPREW